MYNIHESNLGVVIVDDEQGVRNTLKSIFKLHCPNFTLLGEAGNVADGLKLIDATAPDLVILDVEMPDGTGFDLLQQIAQVDFKIIFVTGHNEYAVEAFKFSALDYLLKPIDVDELLNAIDKVNKTVSLENLQLKVSTFLDNVSKLSGDLKKIVLKTNESIYVVHVNEIVRCESDSNYTVFVLGENKKIMVSKTLREYEEILESYGFFRVHQSHLINLHYLIKMDKKDGGYVVMKDGFQVPLSSRRKEKLIRILESM